MADDKLLLSIEKAVPMLEKINHTKCNSCVHRFLIKSKMGGCCVTCLTMVNKNNECIWYEKGEVVGKPLNLELAEKRMDGEIIYFSRWESNI